MSALGKATRNRWVRILGVAFVMYLLAFVDRVNLSMAAPFVRDDLGLTPSGLGFANGLFFWGYIILQIPAGRLASTWSPKRVLLCLLLLWSSISLTTALVQTPLELAVNRFALGLSEGGVLTCTLVLIRNWFTRAERARANALFLLTFPIGPMIAGPISGLILTYSHWRLMFVIEAIPGVLWSLVWWWAIEDRPDDAGWLPEHERVDLAAKLTAERDETVEKISGHWLSTLWHPSVLLLALYNFLALMAEWGVNFWFPTVLKETGLPIGIVGLFASVPSLLGIVMMLAVASSSDRRRERKWHMIAATALAGVPLLVLQVTGGGSWVTVICLSLATGAFLGRFGPFWTLPGEVLPATVAGVGIGLINGFGNLGGAVGPYFFGVVKTHTGNFSLALAAGGASLLLSALVAMLIRTKPPGQAANATRSG
ncbi:MFS transporter [Bradyrhizobium sp. CER78]|uniref:MFS transporter n=1 Tax=Bradyrhizobium sp. CER78 TaxID=3039162 RepID=UPI00244A3D17|nr:MFS transporter [Bradyrhizobium sp. CER78]MDH2386793.1 MFS transporter [Bradyrhizobium sp. CER78]